MRFLRPPDTPDVAYEFFSPFAHVEGRFEWCRLRTATHGTFDAFILLGEGGPAQPATVYVATDAGERFMHERYPESSVHRADSLTIDERDAGRTVVGQLAAKRGPVLAATMTLSAPAEARPELRPYGGDGQPVWGSGRWACWGVDLQLRAWAQGRVAWKDAPPEDLRQVPAIVTIGSFARIAPR